MPSAGGVLLRTVVIGIVLLGTWQLLQLFQLQQLSQRVQQQQQQAAATAASAASVPLLSAAKAEPTPQSFVLTVEQLPRGLPGGADDLIFLTFATASVGELLTNWVLHVQRLRLPSVVAAMDASVLERCGELRVHALDTTEGQAATADNIR